MGFFNKLFSKKKPVSIREPTTEEVNVRLQELLLECRSKLKKFLVTRAAGNGPLKKFGAWTLTKTNTDLFRLDSTQASILINTRPFLARREDGKVGGLLRMSETELCRAIQQGTGPEAFFERVEPVSGGGHELLKDLLAEGPPRKDFFDARPGLEELAGWEPFDVYQMIAQNSGNTLAHVLIHGSSEVLRVLNPHISLRMRRFLNSELGSLLSAGSRPELNPHTRLFSLLEFEGALDEFRNSMHEYQNLKLMRAQHREALRALA